MKIRDFSTIGFCLLLALATGVSAFAQSGTWSTKAPLPIPSPGAKGLVVNDIFYVMRPIAYQYRDDQSLYAYNPQNDQWMEKAPMPTKRCVFGVGVVDGIIYAAGGWDFISTTTLNVLEAFNPITGTWESKAPMPTYRAYLGGAGVNGVFYALGGYIPWQGRISKVEAYDPQANSWTPKTDMLAPRDSFGVGVINGKIYAVGGAEDSGPSPRLEVYDPLQNTWTALSPMPTPRSYPAVEVMDGKLYVFGGNAPDGVNNHYLSAVEVYDPQTDTWTPLASMPTPRGGAAAGAVSGVIYVAGGANELGGTSTPLATHEAFCPQNLAPVANAGLTQVVEVGTAATLDGSKSTDPEGAPLTYNWSVFLKPDGSAPVLTSPDTVSPQLTPDVVGHYVMQLIVVDDQGLPSAPATVTIWGVPKVWKESGNMNLPRQNTRFTTLADGRVLVAGGWTNLVTFPNAPYVAGSIYTVTTELFDPATETWSFAGPMGYNSLNGSSLLNRLHDGKLLICGGQVSIPNGDGMKNAEVFDPATGAWSAVSPMLVRRSGPKTFMLNDGRVLVTGGQHLRTVTNPDGSKFYPSFSLNSAELYDPSTDTWTPTGSMTYGRASHLIMGLPDGRVMVAGGIGALGESYIRQVLSSTEIYDPATGAWTPGPDLLPGRYGSGASILALADGRIMIIGGFGNGGVTLNDVQIYDPQTGTWSFSGSLNQARSNFTRNLMPDGKVLVWGGGDGLTALKSSEIWDPVSGTWSFTGNLNQASIIPVRAQLADGRVLSCCGTDGHQLLANTEIYGSAVTRVNIDIKPGASPNSINLGSNGKVPVAILSSPVFDARRVDPATVTLAGAHVALKGKGNSFMATIEDVNGDGLPDFIVQVDTTALQLSPNDTEAVLEGKTYEGLCIRGTDTVRIVP